MTSRSSTLDHIQIYGAIAAGGMATIEYAGQATAAGVLEVVIKRPHPGFASESEFAAMFMDEARLSLRLRHANIVKTLGVLEQPLALVLEYVPGESLCDLLRLARRARQPVPPAVASALLAGVLHGLHAAHQTSGEDGQPLHIVHRDVTPENILVGVDGVARVLDFGIAKAVGKLRGTPSGEFKGKLAYMAPEQVSGGSATHQTDVYGAALVLWETLAGRALFGRAHNASTLDAVMRAHVPSLRELRADIPEALTRIVQRGLARDPSDRFESAHAMARALESEVGVASQSAVMEWLEQLAGARLRRRREMLRSMRADPRHSSAERSAALLTDPDVSVRRPGQPALVHDADPRAIRAGTRALQTDPHEAWGASAAADSGDPEPRTAVVSFVATTVVTAPQARMALQSATARTGAEHGTPPGWRTRSWLRTAAVLGMAALGTSPIVVPLQASRAAAPTTAPAPASVASSPDAAGEAPAADEAKQDSDAALATEPGDLLAPDSGDLDERQALSPRPEARDGATALERPARALPLRAARRQLRPELGQPPTAHSLSASQAHRNRSTRPTALSDFGPRAPISGQKPWLLSAATRTTSDLEFGWGRR